MLVNLLLFLFWPMITTSGFRSHCLAFTIKSLQLLQMPLSVCLEEDTGDFIKGVHVGWEEQSVDLTEVYNNNFTHLESIFSSPPFLKPSVDISDNQKVLELKIDDIHIDEPLIVLPLSETTKKDTEGTEKERLFEGGSADATPRLRTAEEIKAKHRKEDPSAAAARAREKLAQSGERLEQRLSQRTEELQSWAQNFAQMASKTC